MHRFTKTLSAIGMLMVLQGCSEKPATEPEQTQAPALPAASAPMADHEAESTTTPPVENETPHSQPETSENMDTQDVTQPPESAPATEQAPDEEMASDPLPEDVIGVASAKSEWSELFNNVFQSGDTYFAGLPTEEGLRRVAESGTLVVVSLLTDEQLAKISFNMETLLPELGLSLVRIPISPSTFSVADVDHLASILERNDSKVLVHCGSSNRVGGIWAAYLYLHQEMELEAAISVGKTAGLRPGGMEDAVRRVAESR